MHALLWETAPAFDNSVTFMRLSRYTIVYCVNNCMKSLGQKGIRSKPHPSIIANFSTFLIMYKDLGIYCEINQGRF